MLERPRRWIGYQGARLRFRRSRDPVIPFRGSVSSARRLLLVLPFDQLPLPPAQKLVAFLTSRFSQENITVVTGEQHFTFSRLLPRAHVERLTPEDCTMFFLPRAARLQEIFSRPFDLAIDLNLDFVVPSGYICRESKAPVRAGFARPRADVFFNLQVQRGADTTREQAFDRLAQCLQMF